MIRFLNAQKSEEKSEEKRGEKRMGIEETDKGWVASCEEEDCEWKKTYSTEYKANMGLTGHMKRHGKGEAGEGPPPLSERDVLAKIITEAWKPKGVTIESALRYLDRRGYDDLDALAWALKTLDCPKGQMALILENWRDHLSLGGDIEEIMERTEAGKVREADKNDDATDVLKKVEKREVEDLQRQIERAQLKKKKAELERELDGGPTVTMVRKVKRPALGPDGNPVLDREGKVVYEEYEEPFMQQQPTGQGSFIEGMKFAKDSLLPNQGSGTRNEQIENLERQILALNRKIDTEKEMTFQDKVMERLDRQDRLVSGLYRRGRDRDDYDDPYETVKKRIKETQEFEQDVGGAGGRGRAKTPDEIQGDQNITVMKEGFNTMRKGMDGIQGRMDNFSDVLKEVVKRVLPGEGLREKRSLDDVSDDEILLIDARLREKYGEDYDSAAVPEKEVQEVRDQLRKRKARREKADRGKGVEETDEGWTAECGKCDWSKSGYASRRKAELGLASHMKKHR